MTMVLIIHNRRDDNTATSTSSLPLKKISTGTGSRGTLQTLADGGTCTPNASSSARMAIQISILVL